VKKIESKSSMWLIGALILIVATVAAFAEQRQSSRNPRTPAKSTVTSVRPPVSTHYASPDVQAYHLRSLQRVAGGDPQCAELIRLYSTYAFYGVIAPDHHLLFDLQEGQTRSLMIVVASMQERADSGFPTLANWQFWFEKRLVFTPQPADYTEEWAGIRFAHELLHANRYMRGIMPASPTDAQIQAEEAYVHRFEFGLADFLTSGAFTRTITAWIDRQLSLPDVPEEWFTTPEDALLRQVSALFPPAKSIHEEASRRGSMLFAVNYLLAKKKGLNDDAYSRSFNPKMFHQRL
jgi:hypothetical protein